MAGPGQKFLDYGTDPASWVAAAAADEVDLLYETVGSFVDAMDGLGWTRTRTETAATTVIRGHQQAEVDGRTPYAGARATPGAGAGDRQRHLPGTGL